jgi:hypothetical protein
MFAVDPDVAETLAVIALLKASVDPVDFLSGKKFPIGTGGAG